MKYILTIKPLTQQTFEIDFTENTTLGEMLDAIAEKTGVRRDLCVFIINGKRTFINDEPSQNYLGYLKRHLVNVDQENILIHQVLALGSGPYYRRGPNTITHFANSMIEDSNVHRDLICPILREAIQGKAIKINTKFYDLGGFISYSRKEHGKLHQALRSNQNYEPKSPLGEPLPPILITAMQDNNFAKALDVLARISLQSQAEYDQKYADAAMAVSTKLSV